MPKEYVYNYMKYYKKTGGHTSTFHVYI